ncbi:hypothetical protein ASF49_21510 [Methylobacterium sp. Leaf104]|uniref:hypothetical protein n=1 Tax=Methylobacterium TaxID=407 RepID=UPI0006F5A2A0|nr:MULTISPECIES: hypothetical protein [Methylobacterium]KQP39240.1 hypothetical protein ASF49_21510 [Methylobacterium sp. Leaf104]MCI9882785.1 hypothetical protein [Methylobacterium goesingense]
MAAEIDRRVSGIRASDSRAMRLRRLWRSQDATLRSSGLALGRPVLATIRPAMAGPEASEVPARGLTARELINMARAARRDGADPTGADP